VIRTTHEHPFYVEGRGWLQAAALSPGDLLQSHDGQRLPVESLVEANQNVPVYNLRIAEYHTYFVGSAEWGFSVWTHNMCAQNAGAAMPEEQAPVYGSDPAAFAKYKASLAQQEIESAQLVGSALKSDAQHAAGTFLVNDIGEKGQLFDIVGGDGVKRKLVQMEASVNGQAGVQEWIIDSNGNVTHQFFKPGAPISGVPN
jgi:intein/homing endonuclease